MPGWSNPTRRTHCNKCSGALATYGDGTYWYCPACQKAKRALRRHVQHTPNGVPVLDLRGARERLRAYLQSTPIDAIPRIFELLHRKADFERSL